METGFYYYRAQYYDPTLGRFISQDPIGIDGGDVNFYRYVGNGPLVNRDPMGLSVAIENTLLSKIVIIGLVAAVAHQAVTTEIVLMSQEDVSGILNDAAVFILTIKSNFEGRAHAMMATIISGVWGFIEGNIALDEDRPLVGGTDGGLVTTYLRKEGTQAVERKERICVCQPCLPVPVGGFGYVYHVPEDGVNEPGLKHRQRPHTGLERHTHHLQMHQSPAPVCRCFWNRRTQCFWDRDFIKPTLGFSPLPGAVPAVDAFGGGCK